MSSARFRSCGWINVPVGEGSCLRAIEGLRLDLQIETAKSFTSGQHPRTLFGVGRARRISYASTSTIPKQKCPNSPSSVRDDLLRAGLERN
jgi:hypothetical protein